MSLSVPPISDPYPTPLVGETQSATERRHDQEDATRRRAPHRHTEPTPAVEQPTTAPADPETPPTIGTLIDVRA